MCNNELRNKTKEVKMSKQQLKDLNIALNNFILSPLEKIVILNYINENLLDDLNVSTCYDDLIDDVMIVTGM